ncbi:hypothetical protein [Pseudorhodobacter sp.]|uniref:hypothetical protein n=1 Tax=Pseudorhodobacter sp. TaxID=1934400 RepID=UPI0026471314|nr:hypothetical protein [Pseudorhodobacter sp.]MDN5786197.1 hypothetical protein [Pseudorhodobacter sp.]
MDFRPLKISFICGLCLAALPLAARAQEAGQTVQLVQVAATSSLSETLKIADLIAVMRLEGLDYGAQMEKDLFPGEGGGKWAEIIDHIYDPALMQSRFDAAFSAELAGDDPDQAEIKAFFGAELGQRILGLEVEARRSLMDDAVKDAATARAEDMQADGDPRFAALEEFSQINDLLEANIAGALNSNLAFFQGMAEIGGLSDEMTEEDMLTEVWAQEPSVRTETESWLYPYLALAYGPLSDTEMRQYIDFSKTPAGQKLNTALFGAFDVLFRDISRDLGRAAAHQMQGQDI